MQFKFWPIILSLKKLRFIRGKYKFGAQNVHATSSLEIN